MLAVVLLLVEAALEADVACLAGLLVDDEAHRDAAGRADRGPVVLGQ
jgi:hypothetical protein